MSLPVSACPFDAVAAMLEAVVRMHPLRPKLTVLASRKAAIVVLLAASAGRHPCRLGQYQQVWLENSVIMDRLVESAPSNQIELDLFQGEWSYDIPIPNTVTGKAAVHQLPGSVRFALKRFGPIDDLKVLELGPNECEITIGLSKEKVKEIISIETRSRTFLKCLVIANILGLKNVRFLLGNFIEYLRLRNDERFDLCFACGILYHMTDPVELIELICNNCDRVVVASIYMNDNLIHYDKSKDSTGLPPANWNIVDEIGTEVEYKGLKVKYFKNSYPSGRERGHIVYGHGGVDDHSNIMELDDILRTFEHFGFEIVGEIRDDPDGPRGPHVVFAAKRKGVPLNFERNRYLRIWRYTKHQFGKRILMRR